MNHSPWWGHPPSPSWTGVPHTACTARAVSLDASESQHSGRSRAFAFSGQANQRERAHDPCPWPSEEDTSWLLEDDSITLGKPRRRGDKLASEPSHELYSRLLEESIIFLGTYIDDVVANLVCAQMTHLESENPDKDIHIYINSPGGDVSSLFAIYDTSQYVRNDIMTVCLGEPSGAAAVLRARRASGWRCPTRRCCCASPTGRCGAKRPTSRSRRGRSTSCATGSSESGASRFRVG